MSRFYAPSEAVKKDRIELKSDEAHHISKVMRLQAGDEINVFDGTKEYAGIIEKSTATKVIIRILSSATHSLKDILNITLAVGLPKYKKMDFIIQKATELGVKRIVPIRTQRSLIDFDDKTASKKVTRWQQIAVSACKQCGRIDIPEILLPLKFKEAVSLNAEYDIAFAGWVSEKSQSLKSYLSKKNASKKSRIICYIGPEGGFSKKEVELMSENDIETVSLGQRILRCETAAMYVLSALSFYFEG
jgi:16S rRNA (uracil1498-N3)-methyltransferase